MSNQITENFLVNDASGKPLVTFALFAYNQEKYVREAIEGAFAQTYSPLEIILSDDCSTDNTFRIMQEMAVGYHGNHILVLNQNSKNLNIGGHVNAVNRLARGELVIAAAGDDISYPERVRKIVDAWDSSDRMAGLIHSACCIIHENGTPIQELPCPCLTSLDSAEAVVMSNSFVIGATEAWHKDLFKIFGDLRSDLIHEDKALPFRALLADKKVTYLKQPLVLYRKSVGISSTYSSSGYLSPENRKIILKRLYVDAMQKLDDLKIMPNETLKGIAQATLRRYEIALQFENGIPKFSTLMQMREVAGSKYVVRMVIKWLRNLYLDLRNIDHP